LIYKTKVKQENTTRT